MPILPLSESTDDTGKKRIPPGSITWKQGAFWKYIPPPYNQLKPITIKEAPAGARLTGRKPLDTIQIIGEARGVPEKITVDLGFVDILVTKGRDIDFVGDGLYTDAGTNLSSQTKGMSIGDNLSVKRNKSSKRKETWREKLVSLKGFRP
jgi:hypothetical protein